MVATTIVGLIAACGGGSNETAARPTEAGSASTPTGGGTAKPDEEWAVGTRTMTFVDETRGTPAVPEQSVPAQDTRTIEVIIQYPASGASDRSPTEDAAPVEGRFPLIVLSHGLGGEGVFLSRRGQHWAAAGYVVAIPTFPLTSGPDPTAGDFVEQPRDVSFVIDSVLELAASPDDPLNGRVDTEHIAAAGHSFGGATTYGVALNDCCIDDRIDAAITLGAFKAEFPDGAYREPPPSTPFLIVHGELDDVVAVADTSDVLFQQLSPPAHYLLFTEGDHDNYLGDLSTPGVSSENVHPSPRDDMAELLDVVVVAFLDTYLEVEPDALASVPTLTEDSGLASWQSRAP